MTRRLATVTLRREQGVVFVFCLALIVALLGVVTAVATTSRNTNSAAIQQTESNRADRMIEAGIQRALAQLTATTTTTNTATSAAGAPTLFTDEWATLGSDGDEEFMVGDGSFRIRITDACSLLNINAMTQTQLEKLPLQPEQIDSILDYRETGTTPRIDGAKDEYYNSLSKPYNAKLRDFESLDELLQVKGITYGTIFQPVPGFSGTNLVPGRNNEPVILSDILTVYGYSPLRNSQGEALINVNANGTTAARLQQPPISLPAGLAVQVAARKNWPGIGDILALPAAQSTAIARRILDNLTTTGANRISGKLNLNTATESTLSGVTDLTADLVQAILQRQTQGFNTLGDLADVPGFTGTVLQNTADKFTVASQTFLVKVEGRAGKNAKAAIATIDIQDNAPRVVSICPVPYDDYTTRWEWQTDPVRQTVLKDK